MTRSTYDTGRNGPPVQPSHPPSDERPGFSAWIYAEAVLAADFHRLGGARWRRREA